FGVNLAMRAQMAQSRQAGGHGQRIAGKRSRLIYRPQRRHHLHDVAPAAVSAHRQASADDLAQRHQIRLDPINFLRATVGDAKAGHHFVQNQQRAVTLGDLVQCLQISRGRRMADMVASVPELTRRSISMAGMAWVIISASSASAGVLAPKLVPARAADSMALTTSEWAWPRMSGPQEPT